jgi:hypothetical protein
MPVQGSDPKRPAVFQPFVAPQLMVDPRKHGPELVRIDQAENFPHAVGARLASPDQPLHSARLAYLPFHGM